MNAINQRTQVQTTGSAFPSQPADWNWGYDALGQVVSADSPINTFDRAYQYDQIGNRKKSADGALVTTGSSATVYEANNLNQYSQISVPSVQSVVPIHDQDGNATSYPLPVAPTTNASLGYDGENRLISVTTGSTTVSYVYDSQSRRVARTQGNDVTVYLYDAWNCLAEYNLLNSSFSLNNSHTWGLDLSGSFQGAGGVGGLFSVTKHGAQSTTHYYPTYDGNGNISQYLTASGSIAAHYEYDPFGRSVLASGTSAADFAYRFSTKPVDPATGLFYYGYRWLDTYRGRWLNRDPIEEEGGLNLYGFLGNGGTHRVEILGLTWKRSGWKGRRGDYLGRACPTAKDDSKVSLAMLITGKAEDAGLVLTEPKLGEATDVVPLLKKLEERLRQNVVAATRKFRPRGSGDNILTHHGAKSYGADAIVALANNPDASLDCWSAALFVMGVGLIDTIGADDFTRLRYTMWDIGSVNPIGDTAEVGRLMQNAGNIKGPGGMLLGDFGVIQNYVNYNKLEGDSQAMNVINVGNDRLWAHPLGVKSSQGWTDYLQTAYNGPPDNTGAFRGFRSDQVYFLDVTRIATELWKLRGGQK